MPKDFAGESQKLEGFDQKNKCLSEASFCF